MKFCRKFSLKSEKSEVFLKDFRSEGKIADGIS